MMLSDLIENLAAIQNQQGVVRRGFGRPHSYRGNYADVAFDPISNVTIASMLEHARSARGATYQGYKGGSFEMGGWVDCYIAFDGDATGDGISTQLVLYWADEADRGLPAEEGGDE